MTFGARAKRIAQAVGVLATVTFGAFVGRLPHGLIVPVMIFVLATIDVIGGVVAKSWSTQASIWTFLSGAGLFILLFWIYGISLRFGELSTVTIGWVVLITVADMGLDRFVYRVHFPPSKWAAAFAAVALLAYLCTDNPDPTTGAVSIAPSTASVPLDSGLTAADPAIADQPGPARGD